MSSFPLSPIDGQTYTNNLGTTYVYDATRTAWLIRNQTLIGISGYSGTSGYSGASGTSGISGYSGKSGYSGQSGINGTSGGDGASGYSGYSGQSGTSGTSGYSGAPVSFEIDPTVQTPSTGFTYAKAGFSVVQIATTSVTPVVMTTSGFEPNDILIVNVQSASSGSVDFTCNPPDSNIVEILPNDFGSATFLCFNSGPQKWICTAIAPIDITGLDER